LKRPANVTSKSSTSDLVSQPLGLLPVEPSRSLSARVADRIFSRILELGLRPGDRLPSERELGLETGSSRTVVREAVQSLIGRGIVEARHGKGLFVSTPNGSVAGRAVALLLNSYAGNRHEKVRVIRDLLEVDAVGRAAETALPDDLAAMEQALAIHVRAAAENDLATAARADVDFHLAVATATQNELFPFLLEAMGDVMMWIRVTTMQLPGDLEEGVESHSMILAAVRAKDPSRARRTMRAHLAYSARAMSDADRSTRPRQGESAEATEWNLSSPLRHVGDG
jgi:GntR family transcriptional repressor for pyruvate dehydrogenase complex